MSNRGRRWVWVVAGALLGAVLYAIVVFIYASLVVSLHPLPAPSISSFALVDDELSDDGKDVTSAPDYLPQSIEPRTKDHDVIAAYPLPAWPRKGIKNREYIKRAKN